MERIGQRDHVQKRTVYGGCRFAMRRYLPAKADRAGELRLRFLGLRDGLRASGDPGWPVEHERS